MVHSQLTSPPQTGILDWLSWSLGFRKRFQVTGDSMEPSLREGDWVFSAPCKGIVDEGQAGDIVVLRHPFFRENLLIKRIERVSDQGMFVTGDNPGSSTDSHSFGVVPWSHLVAKVKTVWSMKP
jgi:nickel-type superoxide dismutase maturation protease